MRGIIDRFEDDKVLLEIDDKGMLIFNRELFSKDAREGDVVEYIDGIFVVDEKETRERNQYINDLFKSLIHREDDMIDK